MIEELITHIFNLQKYIYNSIEAESVTFNLGNTKNFEATAVAAQLPEGFKYTNTDKIEYFNYKDLNVNIVNKIDENINNCSNQVTEREEYVYD